MLTSPLKARAPPYNAIGARSLMRLSDCTIELSLLLISMRPYETLIELVLRSSASSRMKRR